MKEYNCISQNMESTVVAEFEDDYYSAAQYHPNAEQLRQ